MLMKRRNIISIVLVLISISLYGCKTKNDNTSSTSIEESEPVEERITEGSLKERLNQLPRVKNLYSLGTSSDFKYLYSFKFDQYIDHDHKELGFFSQKVEIGFNDFDLPNVYVTSGYYTSNNNSTYRNNENELAFLLGCNYVFVEHRYFGTSLPNEINYEDKDTWIYLNTKQAADDAHDIVRQLKRVLDGKWVSTGMSKGGMTTELFAYYHPGDMDLYLPYVAPFCNSFADTRMIKFIYEEAGDLRVVELGDRKTGRNTTGRHPARRPWAKRSTATTGSADSRAGSGRGRTCRRDRARAENPDCSGSNGLPY